MKAAFLRALGVQPCDLGELRLNGHVGSTAKKAKSLNRCRIGGWVVRHERYDHD
jgi:hypothetical protein